MDGLQTWIDIKDYCFSDRTLRERYSFVYSLLCRICIEKVKELTADYTDCFSRLQAVCRLTDYPLYGIDRVRWRARRVMLGLVDADEEVFRYDLKVFAEALAHFMGDVVPEYIADELQGVDVGEKEGSDGSNGFQGAYRNNVLKAVYCVVDSLKPDCAMVRLRDFPCEEPSKLICNSNEQTLDAFTRLKVGMRLSAANCSVADNGDIIPELIVIEPDFLVDITAVTGCVKEYGDSVFTYLLNKLSVDETTPYILLGHVANQFLDDLVNNPSAEFKDSMRQVFRDNMLAFTTCDDIDGQFFNECRRQFDNIRTIVSRLYADGDFIGEEGNVILEPTFFCPNLGLQGRFDFLQGDMKNIIELKSGKWDEYHQHARDEHLMQMILYKEIMYHNLGRRQSTVGGFLLYSKYPYLQEQRTAREMVMRMLIIRNKIVLLEQMLKEGSARGLLEKLTAEDLNVNASSGRLWTDFQKPQIEKSLDMLQQMDDLTSDYFHAFLQFLTREQFLSKVGDGRMDSTRGMASLWNADADTKQSNGDMLSGLQILEVECDEILRSVVSIKFIIPNNDVSMPNYRIGDSVILYRRDSDTDSAVTQQVVRCSVMALESDTITLGLRFRQRNDRIFPLTSNYAVEHDFSESALRSQYASLVKFIKAPQEKRDLLFGKRMPEVDTSVRLKGNYLNEQINGIVLKAKQARDYFLLIGPPGTGKTSVALRSMVEEFLCEGQSILLLSYTNRAVDEICEQLDCPYVRLGRELSCAPEYRQNLLCNMIGENPNREEVRQLLTRTQVVVSTVASMCTYQALFSLRRFDVAIIDEASQILEPQIIGLLTHLDKFIMIGDHKQLPAVVVQGEEQSRVESPLLHDIGLDNCRNSLFERLMKLQHTDATVAMLSRQGRMHQSIGEFASRMFYEGELQPVPIEHQTEPLPYRDYLPEESFVATTRFGFIDVPLPSATERQPKLNRNEAQMIAGLIRQIVELHEKNGIKFNLSTQLGVIVPFRRQIASVRSSISAIPILKPFVSSIMIDTVERYQGSQRDIIIYGTTITRPYELEILSNIVVVDGALIDRKLNVAVTRARKQLFVLGNEKLLRGNELYRMLIEAVKKN